MRQPGMLAAACLYALDHHVDRLAEDHQNARRLAAGLAELRGIKLDPEAVETSIVIFEVNDARGLVERVSDHVELRAVDAHRVPAITHLDVTPDDIDTALDPISRIQQ
jgi:threonine aldolase